MAKHLLWLLLWGSAIPTIKPMHYKLTYSRGFRKHFLKPLIMFLLFCTLQSIKIIRCSYFSTLKLWLNCPCFLLLENSLLEDAGRSSGGGNGYHNVHMNAWALMWKGRGLGEEQRWVWFFTSPAIPCRCGEGHMQLRNLVRSFMGCGTEQDFAELTRLWCSGRRNQIHIKFWHNGRPIGFKLPETLLYCKEQFKLKVIA